MKATTTECDPDEFGVFVPNGIVFCKVNGGGRRTRDEVVLALNDGEAECPHVDAGGESTWQEQPGEPPVDVCSSCGKVRR